MAAGDPKFDPNSAQAQSGYFNPNPNIGISPNFLPNWQPQPYRTVPIVPYTPPSTRKVRVIEYHDNGLVKRIEYAD